MSHMPWWLAPSGPGHAGAVQHDGDAGLVQGDVHQQLVEGTVQEGGVNGDDRVQSAEGHAGGRGECVLLGDADVDHALRDAGRRTCAGPTGISMAPVMPTMSARSSAMSAISSANTEVQDVRRRLRWVRRFRDR